MKLQLSLIDLKQNHTEIEDLIEKEGAKLKKQAIQKAELFGRRNRPHATGDSLAPLVEDIKTGHEHLLSKVYNKIRPQAQFLLGKVDQDLFKEKDKRFDAEIKILEDKNQQDETSIADYHPGSIQLLIWVVIMGTLLLSIGEIIFTTMSFQITGENLLFSLALSISISFAITASSHITAFLLKSSKTRIRRWFIIICALLLVIGVFIALSIIRSRFLAKEAVSINPIFFIVFNLFLFIVSTLMSYIILPTWEEIKQNFRHIKLHRQVVLRKKLIDAIKIEKAKHKDDHNEKSKARLDLLYYANYVAERIKKMYLDCIAIFKSINISYRTDEKTPDCFSQVIPEPNIEDITKTFFSPNNK